MDAPLERCPRCETEIAQAASFCNNCGAYLASTGPFYRLKAKTFALWLLASIPVGIGLVFLVPTFLIANGLIRQAEDPLTETLVSLLWVYGLMGGWSVWCLRRYGISIAQLVGSVPTDYDWRPTVSFIIPMMLYSAAAFWIVHYPIASVAPGYLEDLTSQRLFVTAAESESPNLTNSLILLTLVVAAPLFEEFFFRGLLFSRWAARWGFTRSLLLSSFLFGILHTDPVGAFVFGCAMCIIYMRTRTLWVPIAVHALNNVLAGGLAFLSQPDGDNYASLDLNTELYIALILMVLSSPLVFGLLGRWWPSREAQIPYEANQSTLV